MTDTRIDLLVIGAGPAGLGAAIEAARAGARVVVVDENRKPGGQLFKQIHKFFGSREHLAGTRGFVIGERLLGEARDLGVCVLLDTVAWGIFPGNQVMILRDGRSRGIVARKIVIATGATENALCFPGCTRPGVMTAGAAQTLVNIQRVRPGARALMVGTGNVGLIVSYQLLQAGTEVVGIVEAAPAVGGYDVHANKIRRARVPFHLSHTVVRAVGAPEVAGALLAPVDGGCVPRMEEAFFVECDTICLAVGLSPRIDLPLAAGCQCLHVPDLGGWVPAHNGRMQVAPDLYVAGDVSGIEEASTALEEGRLAGTAAALSLGLLAGDAAEARLEEIRERLRALRCGAFGDKRRTAKEQIVERGCGF